MYKPAVFLLSPQRGHCHGCSAHLAGSLKSWLQVPGSQGKPPRSKSGFVVVINIIIIIAKAVAKPQISNLSIAYTRRHKAKLHQGSGSLWEGLMGTSRHHAHPPGNELDELAKK